MSFLSNQPENINNKQGTGRKSLIKSMVDETVKWDTVIVVAVLLRYIKQHCRTTYETYYYYLMKQCHGGGDVIKSTLSNS